MAHHNVEHLHYIGEWDDARHFNTYLADEFRPTLSVVWSSELGLHSSTLSCAGHSLGGILALVLLGAHPEYAPRIKSLTTLASALFYEDSCVFRPIIHVPNHRERANM